MAVTLLKLPEGVTSLEFEREDWPAVRDVIVERYGDIEVTKRATTDVVSFGGERFWRPILEWEPNLFARTAKGGTMLEEIATVFGKDGIWVPTPVYDGPLLRPAKRRWRKLVLGAALVAVAIAIMTL